MGISGGPTPSQDAGIMGCRPPSWEARRHPRRPRASHEAGLPGGRHPSWDGGLPGWVSASWDATHLRRPIGLLGWGHPRRPVTHHRMPASWDADPPSWEARGIPGGRGHPMRRASQEADTHPGDGGLPGWVSASQDAPILGGGRPPGMGGIPGGRSPITGCRPLRMPTPLLGGPGPPKRRPASY